VVAPAVEEKRYPVKKKKVGRGLGSGGPGLEGEAE
jgi:hypothetical protein